MVQLTKSQHWCRRWLGAEQATSHCLKQCLSNWLTHICSSWGKWINPHWMLVLFVDRWRGLYHIWLINATYLNCGRGYDMITLCTLHDILTIWKAHSLQTMIVYQGAYTHCISHAQLPIKTVQVFTFVTQWGAIRISTLLGYWGIKCSQECLFTHSCLWTRQFLHLHV